MQARIELKPAGDSSQRHTKPNEENENDGTRLDTSSNTINNVSDSMSISAIDGSDISIERAHSVEPQHCPCSSPSLDDGTSYAPLTRLKTIEMQHETLHHVRMAWRAQQRLVKRCLDLYPSSGGTQSAEINNLDCDIISLSGKNGGK